MLKFLSKAVCHNLPEKKPENILNSLEANLNLHITRSANSWQS